MIAFFRVLDFLCVLSRAVFSCWGTYLIVSGQIFEGCAVCAACALGGISRSVTLLRYDVRGEESPLL